jgi:hypothetical protein
MALEEEPIKRSMIYVCIGMSFASIVISFLVNEVQEHRALWVIIQRFFLSLSDK